MYGTLLNNLLRDHFNPTKPDMKEVIKRRKKEWLVVRRFIREARRAGWEITQIANGDEPQNIPDYLSEKDLLSRMFATNEEHLFLSKPFGVPGSRSIHRAWIQFVYGNDGWDAISDYSGNLNNVVEHVRVLSDRMEEKFCRELMARNRRGY